MEYKADKAQQAEKAKFDQMVQNFFSESLTAKLEENRPEILKNQMLPVFIKAFDSALLHKPFPGIDYRGDIYSINANVTLADTNAIEDVSLELMKVAMYFKNIPGTFGYTGDVQSIQNKNSAKLSYVIYSEGLKSAQQEINLLKELLGLQVESKTVATNQATGALDAGIETTEPSNSSSSLDYAKNQRLTHFATLPKSHEPKPAQIMSFCVLS